MYTRFVEVGRVVLLIGGPHKGKIAVISDVLDQTKVRDSAPLLACFSRTSDRTFVPLNMEPRAVFVRSFIAIFDHFLRLSVLL